MGEQKRCKKCNDPIDGDGEYCSGCRIIPRQPKEGWTRGEMKESIRQGEIMQQRMADDAERYKNNPC